MKKDGIIYTVIFTFLISFVFVGILALVNYLTAEKTLRNQELAFQKAVLNSLNISYTDNQQVFDLFNKNIQVSSKSTKNRTLYEYKTNDKIFYVMRFSGQGLWGTITGVLAVNSSIDTIFGLDIISHNETPGLGGRIDEDWFKKQFRMEAISPQGKIRIGSGGSGDSNTGNFEVDGITGASRTSNLMEIIINNQLEIFREILKGGSHE